MRSPWSFSAVILAFFVLASEVASAEHDGVGAGQAAVTTVAVGTIGGRTSVAEDLARERKTRFVAIVGALAAALAFAALVISRRARHRARNGGVDPTRAGSDGVRAEASRPTEPLRKPVRGKVCPTCGERYDSDATYCGRDSTVLVPLN